MLHYESSSVWRLCIFSASFVKECTDVCYVAGEGVGLTLHKDFLYFPYNNTLELRSRRAQFIYDRV